MTKFEFIGGVANGKSMNIPPRLNEIDVPYSPPQVIDSNEYNDMKILKQTYTRRYITMKPSIFTIFAPKHWTDADVFQSLVFINKGANYTTETL